MGGEGEAEDLLGCRAVNRVANLSWFAWDFLNVSTESSTSRETLGPDRLDVSLS